MKKTFTIQLNTDITIDFSTWGLTGAQQRGGYHAKKMVIEHYLEQCGIDEFEVAEKTTNSLFEAMAAVVRAHLDYVTKHSENFELNVNY